MKTENDLIERVREERFKLIDIAFIHPGPKKKKAEAIKKLKKLPIISGNKLVKVA